MSTRTWVFAVSASLAMWGVFACSTADENPATARARTTDSGLDGQSSGGDGSVTPTGAPVCGKLGGYEAVKSIANGIIDAANADCRIAPIVSNALGDEGQTKHFQECFQIFLGGAFQCPGVVYTAGVTKDSDDQDCESMMPNLTFSPKDWAVFGDFNVTPPSIVRAALDSKGLSTDELRSVAAVFEATRATLANPDAVADKYTECADNCASGGTACPVEIVDSGTDGDAADAADSGG